MKKICKYCGSELNVGDKTCESCGASAEEEAVPLKERFKFNNDDYNIDTKKEKKKRGLASKILDGIRYFFGFGFMLSFWTVYPGVARYIGVLAALSITPLIYNLIKGFFDGESVVTRNWGKVQVIVPIVLLVIMGVAPIDEGLKEINCSTDPLVLAIGETRDVDFKTNQRLINLNKFEFTSSDPTVASVTNGRISGLKEGTATVTIMGKDDITGTVTYTVQYVKLAAIDITGDTKLLTGESGKLKAILDPVNASDNEITWQSSNPNIIEVDKDGNIKAIGSGKVVITASSNSGIIASKEVGSFIGVDSIEFESKEITVEKNKGTTVNISLMPTNADKAGIIWSSADEEIATVVNGVITGHKEGKTKITATSVNNEKATIVVHVKEVYAESVATNPTSVSLKAGQTATISVTVAPDNTSDKTVSWTSNDEAVAIVNDGVITGVGHGATVIKATSTNGKVALVNVTVTETSPITLTHFNYTKDSVCGIEWKFGFKNNTQKQINYIEISWNNYNALGDLVYDQISRDSYTAIRFTGPLAPGKSSGSYTNNTRFYNCNYKSSAVSEIKVTYADGSVDNITKYDIIYYTGISN